ncbi:hypothetical protein [Streptomyces sp. BA2]|uniref:hypothetical protein n=1 Tax=Streptomyces sp. BA2 TaxID=436595 RepID=UPI001326C93A|nr:hypothetical protein [Streptomyces sp. BA2]MWA11434.1 hypothetical protein [Streptomyces sp. BA2]
MLARLASHHVRVSVHDQRPALPPDQYAAHAHAGPTKRRVSAGRFPLQQLADRTRRKSSHT